MRAVGYGRTRAGARPQGGTRTPRHRWRGTPARPAGATAGGGDGGGVALVRPVARWPDRRRDRGRAGTVEAERPRRGEALGVASARATHGQGRDGAGADGEARSPGM